MMLGTDKMTKGGPLGNWVYLLQYCEGCGSWQRRRGIVATTAVLLETCKMVLVSGATNMIEKPSGWLFKKFSNISS